MNTVDASLYSPHPSELMKPKPKDLFQEFTEFVQDERLKSLADRFRDLDLHEYVMIKRTMLAMSNIIDDIQGLDYAIENLTPSEESSGGWFKSVREKLSGTKLRNEKKHKIQELRASFRNLAHEGVGFVLLTIYEHLLDNTLSPDVHNKILAFFYEKFQQKLSLLDEITHLLSDNSDEFSEPAQDFDTDLNAFKRHLEKIKELCAFFAQLTDPLAQNDEHFQREMEYLTNQYHKYQDMALRSGTLSNNIAHRHPDELPTAKINQQETFHRLTNGYVDVHTAMIVSDFIYSPEKAEREKNQAIDGIDSLVMVGFSNPTEKADLMYEAAKGQNKGNAYDYEETNMGGSTVGEMSYKTKPDTMMILPGMALDLLTPNQVQEVFRDVELVP